MVLLSVAAPAIAASAMPATMLWTDFPRGSGNRIATTASQTVGGAKITTSLTRSGLAHVGSNWTPTADGRLEMSSNRLTLGDSAQTVALSFSKPVTDVSLTIQDLDRDRDRGLLDPRDFQDEIYIPPGSSDVLAACPWFEGRGPGDAGGSLPRSGHRLRGPQRS
ncbi:hypothetical protein ACTXJ9_20250 [Brachybacterium tyrofermentans]|uniref:hypothetical protein n=1 Tax=Brachybacterium tyrofermentans TaxID=47848 RepID=UPI003FD544C8